MMHRLLFRSVGLVSYILDIVHAMMVISDMSHFVVYAIVFV